MPHTFETPPYPLVGPRFKTGFHCHTVNSDGGLTPEQTAETYRAKGFGALCITDHRQVTPVKGLGRDGMICLPATENGGWPDILAAGVLETADTDLPLAERARRLAAQGGFTVAAHPAYCEATPESYRDCDDLMALEICNAYCDEAYANGLAIELWDMLLGEGKRLWGVAGDDAHLNPKKGYYSDAGRAWVEAWLPSATPEGLLSALKAGAFFSTQGPVFEEIAVTPEGIRVACSPVRQVRWRTFGRVGFVHHAPVDAPIVASELPEWFRPSTFVRIELVDERGKRAWSNPVFVEAVTG